MRRVEKKGRPAVVSKALRDWLSHNFGLEILKAEAFELVGKGPVHVRAHLWLRGENGNERFAELSRRRLRIALLGPDMTVGDVLRKIGEKGGLKFFVSHEQAEITLC